MALAYVPAPFVCPVADCNVFPFDTQDDLDLHLAEHFADSLGTPASVVTLTNPVLTRPAEVVGAGRFVTMANGFGGTTTVRPPRAKVANPPTAKQTDFLRSLLAERVGIADAEEVRNDLNLARDAGELTSSAVSAAITRLLAIAKSAAVAPSSLPDVPAGHYSLDSTGHNDLVFYRVDRPTTGTYAGRVFVKLVVGGKPDSNVPYRNIAGVLARIAEVGIDVAGATYGRELGQCRRCNRTLTDETSRAAGIGPECATK